MSESLSEEFSRLLAGLAELEELIQSSDSSAVIISHCFSLTRHLQACFEQAPAPCMAQAQLIFTSYTDSQNLRLKRMLLALLFSHCHRWHPQSSSGLICAAMTLDVYSWPLNSDTFIRQIKRLDQQVWAHSLIPVSRLLPLRQKAGFYRRFARLSHPQLLLMVVAQVSIAAEKRPASQQWHHSLRRLTKQIPPGCYGMLEPLLPILGLIPPGSIIQRQDNTKAILLSKTRDTYLIKGLQPHSRTFNQYTEQIAVAEPVQPCSALQVENLSLLDTLWDKDWQRLHQEAEASLSAPPARQILSKPPAKLLAIQDLLRQEEPEVDNISAHIAAEGFLARQLKYTASHRSRMNLQMEEVKHALLFQGFERTSSILVQQALLNRLNQQYFPLQQHILQLCVLLGHILEALGERQSRIQNESLVTLGYFFCAGLFISSALKRRVRLPKRGLELFSLDSLFTLPATSSRAQQSMTLARSWQQDRLSLEAIRCHHQLPEDSELSGMSKTLATLLGLSLMICRQIYFADEPEQLVNRQYREQALQYLQLQPQDIRDVIIEVFENSQCYWPLE
ncbi:HDOD domain-containing protein [Lacimicrobium alkaliphilum]|uniref:HDOD domain-containing protein n=1 Tax=Lacimicrobium alkaliphilum TaxID=1526571 RepID=A0ABQ1REC7_9ALTE|nr:HDOD domain-containing protein [Lacimicrobium alkaliphilum]GGD67004.1 hypothetical protein GCM10011357_22740 [Lacimicrobium alkaliphilum]